MKNFLNNTVKYFYKLESKIAFYPTILSLTGTIFAFLMIYFESLGVSDYLIKKAPSLVVNDTETARSLLTTFVAGLISIMVFSFSMVMILLSQASSNFSPRVLPGLISNRRHQVILGVYNSSLLYCIFTLVSIEPNGNKYQLPGFSVLLAIFFMTLCLAAFIYFIHSISQEIQINNIMSHIASVARKRLKVLIDKQIEKSDEFPSTNDWTTLNSKKSGYVQDISLSALASLAQKKEIQLEVIPVKGTYVFENKPLIKLSKAIDDEAIEKVLSSFHYSKSELIEDNYLLAFKQLTEIAIKSMSPGINDPGTAINAIDYLTDLFLLRLQKKDKSEYRDDQDHLVIIINTVSFKQLLFNVMSALRTYCKHDVIIVQKLMFMLLSLLNNQKNACEHYVDAIKQEIENLYEDAKNSLKNSSDLNLLKTTYNNTIKD
ncbi:DUF2254 domain-containing protein [Winogradskyella sp.]|uniref:DUF2254 domain-containing protein n=1 Tax=Winogradskyella sp. TaxID=1883156 RepID=UPI003512A5DC